MEYAVVTAELTRGSPLETHHLVVADSPESAARIARSTARKKTGSPLASTVLVYPVSDDWRVYPILRVVFSGDTVEAMESDSVALSRHAAIRTGHPANRAPLFPVR